MFGVEGDGDWSNLDGTTANASCAGVGCETRSNWLATARGRAGWAWDRVLFYGTGGAAFANVQGGSGLLPFSSSTQTGWTAGAGVEYAFAPNWTAKVEYLFVDLANARGELRHRQSAAAGNHHDLAQREHHPRRHQLQIRRLVAAAGNPRTA